MEIPIPTATKTRPILFTTPMVQAILQGRKTQTRRLNGFNEINQAPGEWHLYGLQQEPELIIGADKYGNDKVKKMSGFYALFEHTELGECYRSIKCPYGQLGHHLYVRETWGQLQDEDGGGFVYRADYPEEDGFKLLNWRPAIHMPRAASRIHLEITHIRAQRLHDITEADAVAEGVYFVDIYEGDATPSSPKGNLRWRNFKNYTNEKSHFINGKATDSYRTLWEKIHGPHSWQQNPWVWAITFKKI